MCRLTATVCTVAQTQHFKDEIPQNKKVIHFTEYNNCSQKKLENKVFLMCFVLWCLTYGKVKSCFTKNKVFRFLGMSIRCFFFTCSKTFVLKKPLVAVIEDSCFESAEHHWNLQRGEDCLEGPAPTNPNYVQGVTAPQICMYCEELMKWEVCKLRISEPRLIIAHCRPWEAARSLLLMEWELTVEATSTRLDRVKNQANSGANCWETAEAAAKRQAAAKCALPSWDFALLASS